MRCPSGEDSRRVWAPVTRTFWPPGGGADPAVKTYLEWLSNPLCFLECQKLNELLSLLNRKRLFEKQTLREISETLGR